MVGMQRNKVCVEKKGVKKPILKENHAKTACFKSVLYGRNALETSVCGWENVLKKSHFCKGIIC